jgi:hypothetical protein
MKGARSVRSAASAMKPTTTGDRAALFFAIGALLVALVVGLGRQVIVSSAFEPELWIFRH